MVSGTVMLAVEMQVVLDRASGIFGLFVLARRDRGGYGPEDHEDRDGGEDRQENCSIHPPADLASEVSWNEDKERDEEDVGETVASGGVSR